MVKACYIYEILHTNHFIDCSCLVFSDIPANDEVVAVEEFIDVGNILGKSWVGLWRGGGGAVLGNGAISEGGAVFS